jgi:hypothetical protein
MVDRARQLVRKLRQQLIARHLELTRQLIDRVRSNRLVELIGSDRLILPGADPRIHLVAESPLPELIDKATERAGAAETGEQTAESAGKAAATKAAQETTETAASAHRGIRART